MRVLVPIPSYGFDPSEVAIPWKLLSQHNIEVVFATPHGNKASADTIMLNGKGLGIWKLLLRANQAAAKAYFEMEINPAFCNPIKYADIRIEQFDALLLPGGHDKGVKEYLESNVLQTVVVRFFALQKIVAAICHGVVLAARSIDPDTNKSVLYNYQTTALLRSQELTAYAMTRLWLSDYYRTYSVTVEDEVKASLKDPDNFIKGPTPLFRDNMQNLNRGFVVKDKNYLSARWPGDVHHFSMELIKMLRGRFN